MITLYIVFNKGLFMILHQYNDGGRSSSGFKGNADDCVTRAITIATGLPYKVVYDDLTRLSKSYVKNHNNKISRHLKKSGTSARTGIFREIYEPYIISLGGVWHSTMKVGSGCQVHLDEKELPDGRLICSLSKHLCAVIDRIVHDTFDPSREGKRCVYGYYIISK